MSAVTGAGPTKCMTGDKHRTAPHPILLLSCALIAVIFPCSLSALPAAGSQSAQSVPFTLTARAAVLTDYATGRILYENNADALLMPASITKLMTLHLVIEKLEERSIGLKDVVTISTNAWALKQTPGSSLMYLEPGQIVTVEELIKGMMVASGNDAATALAEYVAGSKEKFVDLMNEECRWMGYTGMRFTDPSGVGRSNAVSAREFADFCRRYIELHPESLEQILSVRDFEYPQPWNIPDTWPEERKLSIKPVKSYNANYMLWTGIDGLKTGHLDSENYTAAITMKSGDTRLIAVVLGVSGDTLQQGYNARAADTLTLLRYGFNNFSTITPDIPPLKNLRVWMGESGSVGISPLKPLQVTVSTAERDMITYTLDLPESIVAPVAKGQILGSLTFRCGSTVLAHYELQATESVEEAGLAKRAWDALIMKAESLFYEGSSEMARP
jgi:D-alanyl-D-alanine carboxypeptidase (penicillin-binding protein 5/6)